MSPRDIACQELVELVTEYVENALPPAEVAAVEQHLDDCDACLRYLRQLRATVAATGLLPAEHVTDGLSEPTMARLLEAFTHRPSTSGG